MAFRAVDGTLVTRAELDEMVLFISTDIEDKLLSGGAWGRNFLNDGVLKNDIFLSGIAEVLATQFSTEIAPDLQQRLETEKLYNLYIHPQAKFVSTLAAWSYFAPDMPGNFEALRQTENPSDPAAFAARVRLDLGEKRFSPQMLRQALRYQERQYTWLTSDENLPYQDLSLFGYHTIEDWFGPRFTRIAAEFIINSAKIAQQRGYNVSKAEVLADLMRSSETSYRENINSPYLGVTSEQEYFNEQLRQMGMDQNRAIKVWQTVLLARRLFQDAASAALVSPIAFSDYMHYAKESTSGTLYQLPKELKLGDYQALQKLEIY